MKSARAHQDLQRRIAEPRVQSLLINTMAIGEALSGSDAGRIQVRLHSSRTRRRALMNLDDVDREAILHGVAALYLR